MVIILLLLYKKRNERKWNGKKIEPFFVKIGTKTYANKETGELDGIRLLKYVKLPFCQNELKNIGVGDDKDENCVNLE